MNFKKELSGVAAKVAEIMEAELSAKQKQIAKMSEPKHKIDAGDLAKLRAGHKPVKEEQEQIDELSKETLSSYRDKVHGDIAKQYNKGDDNKLSKRLAGSAKASMRLAGVKSGSVKEEVVEEGIEDKIEAARKKAKAAGKKVEEPKKPAAPAKRKVEGKAYGGAKQKEEMEESVLPFTSMLEAYTEHGLKAFVNEQVEEEIQEEVDYLEEAKDGKIDLTHAFKQHGLHYHMTDYYTNSGARKGRSVKSHEEAMKRIHKKVSDDHGPKVAEDMHKHSQSMANSWYRGDDAPKSAAALRAKHNVKWDGDIDKVDDKPDPKFHKEEVDNETYTKEVKDQIASMEGKKKQPKVAAAATQGVKIMDEEEQIEERTLTEPESKKKEEYVKGMKKKLSGFKQRYGERAKEVMYATATKMAKKD